jgi:hypothetical protein
MLTPSILPTFLGSKSGSIDLQCSPLLTWALDSPNTSNTKSISHGQIGKVVQLRPFCVEKVLTILRRKVDKHGMIISKIGEKGNVNFWSRRS